MLELRFAAPDQSMDQLDQGAAKQTSPVIILGHKRESVLHGDTTIWSGCANGCIAARRLLQALEAKDPAAPCQERTGQLSCFVFIHTQA